MGRGVRALRASAHAFLTWTVTREDGSRVFIWLMRGERFVSCSSAGCWRKQAVLAAGREELRAWWLRSHRDCRRIRLAFGRAGAQPRKTAHRLKAGSRLSKASRSWFS